MAEVSGWVIVAVIAVGLVVLGIFVLAYCILCRRSSPSANRKPSPNLIYYWDLSHQIRHVDLMRLHADHPDVGNDMTTSKGRAEFAELIEDHIKETHHFSSREEFALAYYETSAQSFVVVDVARLLTSQDSIEGTAATPLSLIIVDEEAAGTRSISLFAKSSPPRVQADSTRSSHLGTPIGELGDLTENPDAFRVPNVRANWIPPARLYPQATLISVTDLITIVPFNYIDTSTHEAFGDLRQSVTTRLVELLDTGLLKLEKVKKDALGGWEKSLPDGTKIRVTTTKIELFGPDDQEHPSRVLNVEQIKCRYCYAGEWVPYTGPFRLPLGRSCVQVESYREGTLDTQSTSRVYTVQYEYVPVEGEESRY